MATTALTVREWLEGQHRAGQPFALEALDALDVAEDVYAIEEEFGEIDPDVPLQDEARRLVTFEHRVRQLLVDWGAVDAHDPSPPDPVSVLRMLLG